MDNTPPKPEDLSFQVMPRQDSTSHQSAELPRSSQAATYNSKNTNVGSKSSKWIYIIVAVIVLILLGIGAYFLLGSKGSKNTQSTSKLPKVWLQQYFPQNLDSNGNCTDQSICGDNADPDHDGLNNYEEFVAGTNPTNPSTGGSGIADGDAVHIYHTDPLLKYTDRRDVVAQNNWTDGYQIAHGYDPLTPGLPFTDLRKQQIANDTAKYGLHEPTITSLKK
jgi:hypothetical protein